MNILNRLFAKSRPSDAVITRRNESQRARKAALDKARAERLVAISNADHLGRVSIPMRPREEIAAEVREEREARKIPRRLAAPSTGRSESGTP